MKVNYVAKISKYLEQTDTGFTENAANYTVFASYQWKRLKKKFLPTKANNYVEIVRLMTGGIYYYHNLNIC